MGSVCPTSIEVLWTDTPRKKNEEGDRNSCRITRLLPLRKVGFSGVQYRLNYVKKKVLHTPGVTSLRRTIREPEMGLAKVSGSLGILRQNRMS